ncbi:MAG: YdcF family protein [Bacteroidota bacterium]
MKIKFQYQHIILSSIIINLGILALISFIKYEINNLSLIDYRIDYIGNVLNLLISAGVIFGFLLIGIKKKQVEKGRIKFLLVLQILSLISLILSIVLFDFIKLAADEYLFSFPIKKVYTGFLMIVVLFLQVYSLLYGWGIVLGLEKLFEIRTLLRSISAILILILFAVFFVWNVNGNNKNDKIKYDYALIPGAAVWKKDKPSPIFEGRIRKALELYRKGTVANLILTGGSAPGELSEAEVAYKYLTNLGVDYKNLIVEQLSSTTTEQIKYIRNNHKGYISNSDILIISDDFHLSRILQICKFFNIEAAGVSTNYKLTFEKTLFYRTRESIALLLFWFFAI